jgi:hypothetical protein
MAFLEFCFPFPRVFFNILGKETFLRILSKVPLSKTVEKSDRSLAPGCKHIGHARRRLFSSRRGGGPCVPAGQVLLPGRALRSFLAWLPVALSPAKPCLVSGSRENTGPKRTQRASREFRLGVHARTEYYHMVNSCHVHYPFCRFAPTCLIIRSSCRLSERKQKRIASKLVVVLSEHDFPVNYHP